MANNNSNKKQLSATAINAFKPSCKIRDIGEYSRLHVSCTKFGVKKFFYRYRSPRENRVKQVPIGVYVKSVADEDLTPPLGKNRLGLSSARQILTNLKAQRKSGICPRQQLDQEIADQEAQQNALVILENCLSIKDIVEAYLTQHIEDHTSENGKLIAGARKLKRPKRNQKNISCSCRKN